MGGTSSSKKESVVAYFDPKLSSISGYVEIKVSPDNDKESSVIVNLKGFKGKVEHAMHIHEYGDLRLGCKSTGGHYNPDDVTHGSPKFPQRPFHAGDLINNIESDANGTVQIIISSQKYLPVDVIGMSIVVHKLTDDLGLGGQFMNNEFVPYINMDKRILEHLCEERGYFKGNNLAAIDRGILARQMVDQSFTTGNAGQRMACAVLGKSNPDINKLR